MARHRSLRPDRRIPADERDRAAIDAEVWTEGSLAAAALPNGGLSAAQEGGGKMMQALISFRALSRSDFPLLQEWLSAPHVDAWWHEPLDLAGVEAKYGPRVDGVEPTHVFVIEHDGRPVGWIQWYRWADYPEHALQLGAELASGGIDLAIGELAMTGLGLGSVAIREFLRQIVFAEPSVVAVIADPEEGNVRSLRVFEKAGFRVTNTVRLAGENVKRRVVRIERA